MVEDAGSYSFGEFESNQSELNRLKAQATVAWDREKAILLREGISQGMKVLDLACGPGFISESIYELVQPLGMVYGVDINEKLLAVANQQINHENIFFQKENCYELSFADNMFDFAYARFLFQHLEKPVEALKEILKVLKPGGRFLVVDVDDAIFDIFPEPQGFSRFMTEASQYQMKLGGDRRIGKKLGGFLKAVGFKNVSINIDVFTSEQLGLKTFLDITTGFKVELIPQAKKDNAREMLKIIYEDAARHNAFAFAGIYAVSGSK